MSAKRHRIKEGRVSRRRGSSSIEGFRYASLEKIASSRVIFDKADDATPCGDRRSSVSRRKAYPMDPTQ